MRIFRWVLITTAVLWIAVELAVPPLVESRIEQRVRANVGDLTSVAAEISPFPVVSRTVVSERVPVLGVTLREVAGQELPIATLRVELRGVRVDRNDLLRGEVRVRGIETGLIRAEITENAVTRALGASVDLGLGTEVLSRLTLPPHLLPCETEAEVQGGLLVLTCEIDELRGFLAASLT